MTINITTKQQILTSMQVVGEINRVIGSVTRSQEDLDSVSRCVKHLESELSQASLDVKYLNLFEKSIEDSRELILINKPISIINGSIPIPLTKVN